MNMGHTRLLVGEPMLLIHATHNALQHTVNYGVVIVSRNLERTDENVGFKMTALELYTTYDMHDRHVYYTFTQ